MTHLDPTERQKPFRKPFHSQENGYQTQPKHRTQHNFDHLNSYVV
jgi:hypothetical protein